MATCPAGHQSASDDFCEVCGVLIGAPPSLGLDEAPGGGASGAVTGSGTTAGTVGGGHSPGEACPRCGASRTGHFCEACGYDFSAGPAAGTAPPPPAGHAQGAAQPAGPATVLPPAPPAGQPTQGGAASGISQPVPGAPGTSGPAVAKQARWPAAPGQPGDGWAAVVTADRAYYDSVQTASGPDAAGIEFPAYVPQRRFRLAGPEVRIGRHSTSSGIEPEIDLSVPPADPGVSRLHAVLLLGPDGTWSLVDPGSANGTVVNGSEIPPGRPVPLRDGDRIHLGAWTELRLVREA